MQFQQWMEKVNERVLQIAQVDVLDLPDYPFRDSFDGGETPDEVARDLLEENGFDFEADTF